MVTVEDNEVKTCQLKHRITILQNWDSHCLNKDVAAIAETADAKLLKSIIAFNEDQNKGR